MAQKGLHFVKEGRALPPGGSTVMGDKAERTLHLAFGGWTMTEGAILGVKVSVDALDALVEGISVLDADNGGLSSSFPRLRC